MSAEYMQKAAEAVNAALPDGHGFIILAAPFSKDAVMRYASNIDRECAIRMLKHYLFQIGERENWMNDIQ